MNNPTTETRHKVAVVVGRWHIVHKGHQTLFNKALSVADKVVIVIGSAFRSRDPRNPFNWQERAQMIEAALSPQDRERVVFLPVRDYHDNVRWNKAVRKGMEAHAERTDSVVLVGFKKDWTSEYLSHMGWKLLAVEQEHSISATDLRSVYFEAQNMDAALTVMSPYIAPGVRDWLQAWSKLGEYQLRAQEHKDIVEYRKEYPAGTYNTADSLVRVGDYVLLIKRKSKFGNGLWALPGGFLNPNERFLTGAIRELREETGFPLPEYALLNALQGSPILLDEPLRSPRARLISNMFYFRFGAMAQLPEVSPRDDAKETRWFHIDELAGIEEQLFEDHFLALDRALDLIKD